MALLLFRRFWTEYVYIKILRFSRQAIGRYREKKGGRADMGNGKKETRVWSCCSCASSKHEVQAIDIFEIVLFPLKKSNAAAIASMAVIWYLVLLITNAGVTPMEKTQNPFSSLLDRLLARTRPKNKKLQKRPLPLPKKKETIFPLPRW